MKTNKYVVRCKKTNKDIFGFGHNHKAGQYISLHDCKGTFILSNAMIFTKKKNDCGLIGLTKKVFGSSWRDYYEFLPVVIKTVLV